MDELKDKLTGLFSKGKKTGFKGQGHRLGTAVPAPAKPQPQAASSSSAGQPRGPAPQQQTSNAPNLQQSHGATTPVSRGVDPRQELKPATEFSPFTAVIGGGAACTTNKMAAGGQPASSGAAGTSAPHVQPQLPQPQQRQQQQRQQVAQPELLQVPPAVQEEVQHCLALISSQPAAAVGSMEVLQKLLSNLLTSPQEPKFRQLRLGPDPNPKVQATILAVSGALELLKACGFEVLTDAPGSQEAGATYAYFLDDAKLSYVEAGLLQLQVVSQAAREAQQQHDSQGPPPPPQQQPQPSQAAPPATISSSHSSSSMVAAPATKQPPQATVATAAGAAAATTAVQQPPVARDTLVLLPAAPDANVPDFFFERTAAEVKAEFMALLRQRQQQQVVASKAWKDLQRGATGSSAKQPAVITLRVRFPEGVCLQGCFGVREPVAAVFDWVTGSLRDAGLTYELITPSRTALSPAGSVGAADLAGAVLNFRGLSHTQRGGYLVGEGGQQLPFLGDALLARAKAD